MTAESLRRVFGIVLIVVGLCVSVVSIRLLKFFDDKTDNDRRMAVAMEELLSYVKKPAQKGRASGRALRHQTFVPFEGSEQPERSKPNAQELGLSVLVVKSKVHRCSE